MFGSRYPIIQAPMAGGITTPELVAAVCNAGGLGSLGAAYLSPSQIREAVAQIRSMTDRPFAVNLFTIDAAPLDRDPTPMLQIIAQYHRELGIAEPTLPEKPAERFDEQAAVLVELRVPVFSFTFGIPSDQWLAAFRQAGIVTVGTATTEDEAEMIEAAGVDAVVAQGAEAGGHRGTFAHPFEEAMVPTLRLVFDIANAVHIPVIAAGGIMDGRGIRAALDSGASAAQLGTAFVVCPESGAAPAYKAALLCAEEDDTVITRAFSGRHARTLQNRFIAEVESKKDAILPYPWQNAATRPMRSAAAKAGKSEYLSLWAGQAVAFTREMPAGDLVARLVKEAAMETGEPPDIWLPPTHPHPHPQEHPREYEAW